MIQEKLPTPCPVIPINPTPFSQAMTGSEALRKSSSEVGYACKKEIGHQTLFTALQRGRAVNIAPRALQGEGFLTCPQECKQRKLPGSWQAT